MITATDPREQENLLQSVERALGQVSPALSRALRESALKLVRQGKIAFGDLRDLLSWERLAPEPRRTSPAS